MTTRAPFTTQPPGVPVAPLADPWRPRRKSKSHPTHTFPVPFLVLALAAILAPTGKEAATMEPDGLAAILPDPEERRRYLHTLHKLTHRPISAQRLADRAKLKHRRAVILTALRADPRLQRIREPTTGPERYAWRPEYRHGVPARRAPA